MTRVVAVVDEASLSENDKAAFNDAISLMERLGQTKVTRPKPPRPPRPPRPPKPEKPKMTPSERGRAGAIGLWGTPDNPKPRNPNRKYGRPKISAEERSIQPMMRRVWNALPDDGTYMLIDTLADKMGIKPVNARATLCLLKARGFAVPRNSTVQYAKGKFFVEWARSVDHLPEI